MSNHRRYGSNEGRNSLMSTRVLKGLLILAILALAIGCDQATKQIARSQLMGRGTVALANELLVLRYVENAGGFLGVGARLPRPARIVAFIAFPLLILAGMLVSLARNRETGWILIAGLSFIAGGGFGNLIDRLFRDGRVSDFINLGIGTLRTGIFNFADLSVLIGCLLLLVSPRRRNT
jgi:signal peptidase II